MSVKTSGGDKENGIVGNVFDKYGSRNPVVRWIVNGFETALRGLVEKVSPSEIHKIGCGEGYWVLRWNEQGIVARGSDFSFHVIDLARDTAVSRSDGVP